MSRFLGETARRISPYTPGEQPRNRRYIKLNTNESPYPPSPRVKEALETLDWEALRLYPDPDALELRREMAAYYRLSPQQVFAAGGSDEALAYAFMAFFSPGDKVLFPDITYGFYKVYADLFGLGAVEIPLREDFTIGIEDYISASGHAFLANPNAPTGILLGQEAIRRLLESDPGRLVVVDEAYIDFAGAGSCVSLIGEYDNLLVVQTFSKSRSLAGMRLGFAFGAPPLMEGLERMKYSFNPYNLDLCSIKVGVAAIRDRVYLEETAGRVVATRERTKAALEAMGCSVLPSSTNFLFAAPPGMGGLALFQGLREAGILTRYFPGGRTAPFVRITIGTDEEMDEVLRVAARLINPKG